MKVAEALVIFQQYHSNDPKIFLDTYFWSVMVKHELSYRYNGCPNEILKWCSEQFDKEDYVVIGRKIWFSSQDQYMQFWLTWEEKLINLDNQNNVISI